MFYICYICFFLLWCNGLNCATELRNYSPLLVVVIMVKNEEAVIEATLQPFVNAGIDSFFVFDTGSTDKTISVTETFFAYHAITQGYIEQEPFVDFATSRNKALQRAKLLFPRAAFMIMLDAEWYLQNVSALVDFCALCLKRHDMYATYLIRIVNGAVDFYMPRLIRCASAVQFEGVVHETICSQTRIKVPEHIYFEYSPTLCGIEKTQKRYNRDRELLYEEHAKNPTNKRTLFYLAFTCEALGNLEEAYDLYKKRILLSDGDEEDFMAHYRLASLIERLSSTNNNYLWQEALYYYLQAYQLRPHRSEPLVAIARYYSDCNEIEIASLFAQKALEIPYPCADLLFIEKQAYEI